MKKIEATMSFKLKLAQSETKSVEESKNALHLREKLVPKEIKLIALERMLITFSMNWPK